MLYFDKTKIVVWKERPENVDLDQTESFTPTIDAQSGWILWYDYTTYDSFGPQVGISVDVLDMYETYEDAVKMASLLREYERTSAYGNPERSKEDIREEFFYANKDTERKPYPPFGWGIDLVSIYVDHVEIMDAPDEAIRKRVF